MITIPKEVKYALNLLEKAGFEGYMTGGCVRDYVMGMSPKDYDITTSALPEETKAVFSEFNVIETGIKHGTVTVLIEGMPLEITTYRTEGEYLDSRHPSSVAFTRSLKEDAERRDFTMNAMACDVRGNLCDFFDGCEDISAKVIRCVGNPNERFQEDALRIMRALRFSSVLGFEIEKSTSDAAFRHKELLKKISMERIQTEFIKLICGKDAKRVILEYTDILGVVIPELLEMKGFKQRNVHHIYDVLEHCAVAVENVTEEPVLRLAALLHDAGKPEVFTVDEDGTGHFYGHSAVSEKKAEEIMNRLKFDNNTKEQVLKLVKYHDVLIELSEKSVKRMLSKVGTELYYKLIELKRADNMAQNPVYRDRQKYCDELERIATKVIQDESCFDLKDLAVNGHDLIEAGIPAGKEIGRILNLLLYDVIDSKVENEKEKLISRMNMLYRT